MKCIHFVPYYPPERLGGVGEFVAGLHGALRAAGHESLVVTAGIRSQPDVRRIARSPLGWFLKTALWAGRAGRYDVVHCQAGEALPVLFLLRLRRRRPKILITFHVSYVGIAASFRPYTIEGRTFALGLRPFFYRTIVSGVHRLFDYLATLLCDAVNTISRQSAWDVLGEERAKDARVVYYGLAEHYRAEENAVSATGPVEILYAGTGGHRKRVASLPYVLAAVRREIPGARMRIVGFLPEKEPEVMKILVKLDLLAAIDFVGVKRSAELPLYYASAGVLVVPSAYEGLPFVILEAMRSGLPVVATRVSGHPEVIEDGENGFLVDLDRPQQMAERCVRILRNPALRDRMARAARQTIRERFSLSRQVREYLEIYESLAPVQNGGRSRRSTTDLGQNQAR